MPTKYRDTLNKAHYGKLICTVDIGSSCLLLYPINEWNVIAQKLTTLSDMDPSQRAIKRLLLGYATECELDTNGRMLISPTLRQYANLDKKLMLVGQLNKFELWDEATWTQEIANSLEQIQGENLIENTRLADFSL